MAFHTYDYARHFVSAYTRIIGLEGTRDGVEDQGKLTCVAAFPIGIDSDRFIQDLELPQVQDHIKELKERFAGRKAIGILTHWRKVEGREMLFSRDWVAGGETSWKTVE
ncbi:unnamed protein product [Camellia sinensis]